MKKTTALDYGCTIEEGPELLARAREYYETFPSGTSFQPQKFYRELMGEIKSGEIVWVRFPGERKNFVFRGGTTPDEMREEFRAREIQSGTAWIKAVVEVADEITGRCGPELYTQHPWEWTL